MKNFQKYLEELDIKGLSGIPGEGQKKPGEPNYLSDVERRAKSRLGIQGYAQGDPRGVMPAVNKMMANAQKLVELCSGHEKEIEKLAAEVINKLYKTIIEAYDIKLDIKIVSQSELENIMRKRGFWQPKEVTAYSEQQKGKKPVIRAYGVDLSMLLHEAVKGIWQVLSSGAIPKDKQLAGEIKKNITFEDEPQDWRYGPEIAADLRDFINENPKSDIAGVREEVWKVMVDEDTMSAEEFLALFRGILAKTPEARKKIDDMIDRIAPKYEKFNRELEEYQKQMAEYNRQMKEYEKQMAEWSKQRKMAGRGKPVTKVEPQQPQQEESYEDMTEAELDDQINKGLDNRDFALVAKLSKIKQEKFG